MATSSQIKQQNNTIINKAYRATMFTVEGHGLRKEFTDRLQAEAFLRCFFESHEIKRDREIEDNRVTIMYGCRKAAEVPENSKDIVSYKYFTLNLIAHL